MAEPHPIVARMYADEGLHDVLIASGYGVTLSVRSGHLVIVDGIGRARRERRIPRLPRTVSRLVISGVTGYLSLEAVRWLSDAGIGWVQLGPGNEILASSGQTRNDASLLRAQGQASGSDTGVEITRTLTTAKLAAQEKLLHDVLPSPGAEQVIRGCIADAARAGTIEAIRSAEGVAARAYWDTWTGRVAVPWSPHSLAKIPAHWRVFGQRPSMLSGRNRTATDPVNALLNYAYRIAEAQAVLACHAAGLHPALGICHADKESRDSMALDLIEVARPACDRLVLSMLAPDGSIPYDDGYPAYFSRRWVTEGGAGQCELVPPVTHRLAASSDSLAAVILPHALDTARALSTGTVRLTGRRVAGQAKEHHGFPRNRLRPGASADDLMPAGVWDSVAPLIPVRERAPGKPGRPRLVGDREAAAWLVARHVLGVPWTQIPPDRETLGARLREWQRAGIWDTIRAAAEAAGHLDALTVR